MIQKCQTSTTDFVQNYQGIGWKFVEFFLNKRFICQVCQIEIVFYKLTGTTKILKSKYRCTEVSHMYLYILILNPQIIHCFTSLHNKISIYLHFVSVSFCYITRYALWEFLYGPVAILLLLNVCCFTMTAVKLYQYQQSTKMATQNMKKNRQS